MYDRAGRSEGLAFVTYTHPSDARTAITEFDGANAKGQPIRVTLISTRRDRNPFDNVERPRGSLFDRVERPRDARSLSPGAGGSDTENSAPRRRGGRRAGGGAAGGAGGRYRRSDVSKPAPEHIDRYVPGQRRSPGPRAGGGASNGRRQGGGEGRRTGNPRPRKTQEELDAEMDDYWGAGGGTGAAGGETAPVEQSAQPATAAAPAAAAPAGGDDDIDMIE